MDELNPEGGYTERPFPGPGLPEPPVVAPPGLPGGSVIVGTAGDDQLTGTRFADRVYGLGGSDAIAGGAGNDQLSGGGGSDKIAGGNGNDTLLGGPGADALDGGAGDDTLVGGDGSDVLQGGAGADVFRYLSVPPPPPPDVRIRPEEITDFSQAEGDKIDLSAIDARPDLPGDQAFLFADGIDFFQYQPGTVTTFRGEDSTTVSADTGEGVLTVVAQGVVTFAEGDFIL